MKRTKRTPKKRGKQRRDWQSKFLKALANCGNVTEACRLARCGRTAAYEQYKNSPTFAAAWDDAIEQGADVLENEARRRAVEGTERTVYHAGKPVGSYREYSDTLLIFLLKGTRPEKYRDRVQHDYGKIDPSTWTDQQIFAYRAGVPLAQVLAMKPDDPAPDPVEPKKDTVH